MGETPSSTKDNIESFDFHLEKPSSPKSNSSGNSIGKSKDFLSNGFAVLSAVGSAASSIMAIKSFTSDEDKFWKCFPSEAEHEKQLASERKKNGDTFYPNYEEYISTIDEAKKKGSCFTIKAKTHFFSKWEWCCYIEK